MKYFFTHLIETERTEFKQNPQKFKFVMQSEILNNFHNSSVKNVMISDDKVSFSGDIFRFIWNGFNMLNPISKAEVSLKNIGSGIYITYKLFFWEFFILACLFSLIPILAIFPDFTFRVIAMIMIWMVYLISTLLATHRFENNLKKLVLKNGGKI